MDLLFSLMAEARRRDASDLHLKAGASPVVRAVGRLESAFDGELTDEDLEGIAAVLLAPRTLKDLRAAGELDLALEVPELGRFRVSAYIQRGRPAFALRLVRAEVPKLEDLRLPAATIADYAAFPDGLVLVSGPSGAGKTTTLAALIDRINHTQARHILTLEDPIEYAFSDNLSRVEQREVGTDTPRFDGALRSVVRQDPDVIAIGEIRDLPSIRTALEASGTGHLVLATLHANSVGQALQRVGDFYQPAERDSVMRQLAGVLRSVTCQRLVPGAHGGRLPAMEVLRVTQLARRMIGEGQLAGLDGLMLEGADHGMTTFDSDLYDLAQRGEISREVALDEATNPEQLGMRFRGIWSREQRVLG